MTTHGVPDNDAALWPVLATGDTADIFLISEDRVLRRYRIAIDVSAEVTLMRHVAEHDFPVPEIFEASGGDVVMERLHGPTLLQALAAGELNLQDGADIMADLLRRLHLVPTPPGTPHDDVIVHLDVHPANIILSESHGPALIDWANARTGSPDLDIAVSALILGEVAADSDGDYSRAAKAMLVAFLAVARGNPVGQLEAAVASRLADPALIPGETALVLPAAELVRQYAPEIIIGRGDRNQRV